ncbi:MAG: phosphatidate cytidylyltransferase [Gammaproteobacteria bacterium]|nr:phosphatidate cytidylyltransferase [Gammaproteobacteria bacterium]
MLKIRLLTAAVLIPLVIWGVLALPTPYFSVLVALIMAQAAWEWSALAGITQIRGRALYIGLLLLTLWGISTAAPAGVLIAAVAGWCLAAVTELRHPAGVALLSRHNVAAVAGLWVLAPAWLAVTHLHALPAQGPYWVLFLMALIWSADGAAYFAGRRWGKTRLAPSISPGKTWAGVWGALAATLLIAPIAGIVAGLARPQLTWFIVLCLGTVVFSIVGDLFESIYKRIRGVKDSGRLLPGHGGMLDRIDSLTAAAPVFVLGVWLLGGVQ